MLGSARFLSVVVLVSGCSIFLSACNGGSVKFGPENVTANADIPDSVYAGSTATVDVALTASAGTGGTARVRLVDVGTVTPGIDCGPAQTISIGGNGGAFACQAPQANLGGSNEHQIQVEVNGKANLRDPVPVEVVNGGRVYATLTNASGDPIEDADPGETINVVFGAEISRRPVAGRYTVSAPGDWQVGGDNGTCTIDMNSPSSCTVPVTVPAAATAATYGLDLGKADGSSALSPYVLPVTVEGLSLTASSADTDDSLKFYLAQNISHTLYTGTGAGGTPFNYHPVFLFENTSKTPLTITSVSVPALSAVKAGIVPTPNKEADYATLTTPATTTLKPFDASTGGPLYAVTGSLATGSALSTKTIAVDISGARKYQTEVTFVPYVAGKVAVRLVPVPTGAAIHVAALIQHWPLDPTATTPSYMVDFTPVPAAQTYYTGVISTAPSADYGKPVIPGEFDKYQVVASQSHGLLLYVPHGRSGVIYFNLGKITSTSPPSHTASPTPPRWFRVEFSYGGPAGAADRDTNESLYVDQSYVNAITVMGQVNVMGSLSPLDLLTQSDTRGINSGHFSLSSQHIFQAMRKQFDDQDDPTVWGYDCNRQEGLQSYVRAIFTRTGTTCRIARYTGILAPIDVSGLATQSWVYPTKSTTYCVDPMRPGIVDSSGNCAYKYATTHYYNPYIDALWTYLKTNPIYIRTTFAIGQQSGIGLKDCIVKGYVNSSGDLVFSAVSPASTCPTSDGGNGSNTVDSLKMTKLLPCDFLEAAGSSSCHLGPRPEISKTGNFQLGLYGENKSYRSAVGEVLASFQAAGLFPLCMSPPYKDYIDTYTPSSGGGPYPVMDRRTARALLAHHMAYQNPTCLKNIGARPVWNVYAEILGNYDNVYNYTYGDFLGLSGTVTFSPPGGTVPQQWFDDLGQVAQPVTVTIK